MHKIPVFWKHLEKNSAFSALLCVRSQWINFINVKWLECTEKRCINPVHCYCDYHERFHGTRFVCDSPASQSVDNQFPPLCVCVLKPSLVAKYFKKTKQRKHCSFFCFAHILFLRFYSKFENFCKIIKNYFKIMLFWNVDGKKKVDGSRLKRSTFMGKSRLNVHKTASYTF